jgi:hypothetical protein
MSYKMFKHNESLCGERNIEDIFAQLVSKSYIGFSNYEIIQFEYYYGVKVFDSIEEYANKAAELEFLNTIILVKLHDINSKDDNSCYSVYMSKNPPNFTRVMTILSIDRSFPSHQQT